MSKMTRKVFLRLFLVGSALLASACSFGTLPPPEMPPPHCHLGRGVRHAAKACTSGKTFISTTTPWSSPW